MKRKRMLPRLPRDVLSIIYERTLSIHQRSILAQVSKCFRSISLKDPELKWARHVRDLYADDPERCLRLMEKMIDRNPVGSLDLWYVWVKTRLEKDAKKFFRVAREALMHRDDRFLRLLTHRVDRVVRTSIIAGACMHVSIVERVIENEYGPVDHHRILNNACCWNAIDVVRLYMEQHMELIPSVENALEIACVWGHNRIALILYLSNISPHVDLEHLRTVSLRNGNPFFLDL